MAPIIVVRCCSLVWVPKRIPTPRSKPSSTTYIRIANAITAAQKCTSHIVASLRRSASGGRFGRAGRLHWAVSCCGCVPHPGLGRAFTQQTVDVAEAEPVDEGVDDDIAEQRRKRLRPGQARRHRVGGAQYPVHDPWLTPDFGGDPAGNYRHETGWEGEECAPQKPSRRLQPAAEAQPIAEPADGEY